MSFPLLPLDILYISIVHFKAYANGDVDLSHSLGADRELHVQTWSSRATTRMLCWKGCVALLKDACGEAEVEDLMP
jgi:hypothetical protein